MARRPPSRGTRGTPNEPNAGGGGAAGGGTRAGGQQWGAGLNLDPSGLKEFTKALEDAAKQAERLWEPFKNTAEASRKTEAFFNKLKTQIKEAQKLGAGLPGSGSGGSGGGGGSGGRGGGNGGSSTMPDVERVKTMPEMAMASGHRMGRAFMRGFGDDSPGFSPTWREARRAGMPFGQAFGFSAMAGIGAAGEAGPGVSWSQAALMTVGSIQRYGGRQIGEAITNQRVATDVSLQTAPGGGWSQDYRNQVARTLMQSGTYGATPDDRMAASRMAFSRGLQGMQDPRAGGIWQGAANMAAMQGVSLTQSMGVQSNLQAPGVVNTMGMLGINIRPGGAQQDQQQTFKQLRDYIFRPLKARFGRNPTAEEIRLTIQTPGTPSYVLLNQVFQGDQATRDAFVAWALNSATAGRDLTASESDLKAAPGAQTKTTEAGLRGETAGKARAETYEGMLDSAEGLDRVIKELHSGFQGILDVVPGLGTGLGALAGILQGLPGIGGSVAVGGGTGGSTLGVGSGGTPTSGGGGGGGGGGIVEAATSYLVGRTAVKAVSKAGRGLFRGVTKWLPKAASKLAGPAALVGSVLDQPSHHTPAPKESTSDTGEQMITVKNPYGPDPPKVRKSEWDKLMADPWNYTPPEWAEWMGKHKNSAGFVRSQAQEASKKGGTGDPVYPWSRSYGIGDPVPGAEGGSTTLRGDGRSTGMNADFVSRLARMFTDNPRLSLTSGFRTRAEQERLYREKPGLAAKPGSSLHEKGLAADIGPRSEYGWLAQNVGKYGLYLPMPQKEPWHVQPSGGVSGGAVAGSTEAGGGMEDAGSPGGTVEAVAGAGGMTGPSFGSSGPSFGSGFAAASAAASSGGSGSGGSVPTMGPVAGVSTTGTLSIEEVLRLAKGAGFSGTALKTIVAVAMAESGLRPGAQGDINLQDSKWGPSVGLFQIRTVKAETGKGSDRDINALLADPNFQARAAWHISGGGKNFGPWSVYTSGAYKSNLGQVQQKMQETGIGDPVGGGSQIIMASGGGGGGIVIQQANFTAQIARGTPEEAERFARFVMETLSNRDRLLQIGGGRG